MNQQTTHTLRKLFLRIDPFPASDPRRRTAWRSFKRDYLSQPKPARNKFLAQLKRQIEVMEMVKA